MSMYAFLHPALAQTRDYFRSPETEMLQYVVAFPCDSSKMVPHGIWWRESCSDRKCIVGSKRSAPLES